MIPVAKVAGATDTRYAELTRGRALAVVGLIVAAAAWLLASVMAAPPAAGTSAASARGKGGDAALYQAVVERVRAGEGYYDAAGAELRARSYPVRPVFNWRQPTYAWLLSRLPSPLVGNALLALIGAAVVWSTLLWTRASAPRLRPAIVVALMTVTVAGALVTEYVFMQEAWAGLLIALSVALFARDRWRPAVAACLAALAFRELALLPCAVGLALALRRRRWPEVAAWLVGLAAYAALMAWHFSQVLRHTRPDDLARGWIALGGGSFLVETSRWNPLLVGLPAPAVAVVLPFAVLGLVGWRDAGAARAALIVVGYLTSFAFVGNPFNDYWGGLYAPLLSLGLMASPAAVRDLARALRSGAPPGR